jgi:predicted Rossmann fold nucleotide-binding protein DprA/Smf involved in DNA uptake
LQQPVTLDELQFKTALTIEELQDRLFVLQVEGRVKQHFSGTWQHI